ncbi:MAG: hypothetical protein ACR2IH_04435 [Pyrinomonadaceae bacterium]
MNPLSESTQPKTSLKLLLSEIIDYAGLFPPSQLSMKAAVENYAEYRTSGFAWMLGRFITPVSRLDEFLEESDELIRADAGSPWRLSVLAGEDLSDTFRRIKLFNSQNAPRVVCDMLEVKANTVSKVENSLALLPKEITAYFEISTGEAFVDLVATLALRGQRAKIRTGGAAREHFPATREIIRFVRTCQAANIPFKATAGLHHPLRCFRPLSYAADAPQGTMHGFLNMLVMTGFARESFRPSLLEQIMEEEFEEVFTFRDNGLTWRNDHFLSNGHIERLRANGLNSFGSCSFEEPIADLQSMGLL